MCTVSFIKSGNKIFITSNRDENIKRSLALPPKLHQQGVFNIISPKDPLSLGTWIALKNGTSAMVLLNGAFLKHQQNPPYRKSRGEIFNNIFYNEDSIKAFVAIDLNNIEPFTLILWQQNSLHQLQWDGSSKRIIEKDSEVAHIWSSCTLYTQDNISYRQQFFKRWLTQQTIFTKEVISKFHLHTNVDNEAEKNIRINRNNGMLTVSISYIEIDKGNANFFYSDLIENKNYQIPYEIL